MRIQTCIALAAGAVVCSGTGAVGDNTNFLFSPYPKGSAHGVKIESLFGDPIAPVDNRDKCALWFVLPADGSDIFGDSMAKAANCIDLEKPSSPSRGAGGKITSMSLVKLHDEKGHYTGYYYLECISGFGSIGGYAFHKTQTPARMNPYSHKTSKVGLLSKKAWKGASSLMKGILGGEDNVVDHVTVPLTVKGEVRVDEQFQIGAAKFCDQVYRMRQEMIGSGKGGENDN